MSSESNKPAKRRGRPPLADPRKERLQVPCNQRELDGVEMGARSIHTSDYPAGIPLAVYVRLMALYARVPRKTAQRVLKAWGFGELLDDGRGANPPKAAGARVDDSPAEALTEEEDAAP